MHQKFELNEREKDLLVFLVGLIVVAVWLLCKP